jgi:hypothetical protein
MSEYLSGLNEWTVDVKNKDTALKKGQISETSAEAKPRPPVRGRVSNTVKAEELKPKKEASTKNASKKKKWNEEVEKRKEEATAAGHTYDYFKDKWDKYDIDAALKDVDEESSEDEAPKKAPKAKGELVSC